MKLLALATRVGVERIPPAGVARMADITALEQGPSSISRVFARVSILARAANNPVLRAGNHYAAAPCKSENCSKSETSMLGATSARFAFAGFGFFSLSGSRLSISST